MELFGLGKKEEYEDIYGWDEDDPRNYEDLSEEEDVEARIEELRGTIGRGTCLYCGVRNAMRYEAGTCFICTECGKSVHEDVYYRWIAGEDIEMED